MKSTLYCLAMPKTKGRPRRDSYRKLEGGEALSTNFKINKLELVWEPEFLSRKDSRRLWDYWYSIKGSTKWTDAEYWRDNKWQLLYLDDGSFEFTLNWIAFSKPEQEMKIRKYWEEDHEALNCYMQYRLRKVLSQVGVFGTLDFPPREDTAKFAQLRMFCSQGELANLLLAGEKFPYLKILKARLGRFQLLQVASGELSSSVKKLS